ATGATRARRTIRATRTTGATGARRTIRAARAAGATLGAVRAISTGFGVTAGSGAATVTGAGPLRASAGGATGRIRRPVGTILAVLRLRVRVRAPAALGVRVTGTAVASATGSATRPTRSARS